MFGDGFPTSAYESNVISYDFTYVERVTDATCYACRSARRSLQAAEGSDEDTGASFHDPQKAQAAHQCREAPVYLHGQFDNLHTVTASIVMALLNEKPRIDVETTDSDEIIRQLRTAYRCNRLDYTGRYSVAVKVLCRKYGVRVYDLPSLKDVREYCAEQMDTLWNEVKRFSNPHTYYVDLSQKLWELKRDMIEGHGKI